MATLEELASEKERELRELRQRAALANKENIKSAEDEVAHERVKLSRLHADFDYNLSLLSQRDEELSRYEELFAGVKGVINSLMADNSQLKVQLASLTDELCQCRQGQEEIKKHYISRIEELHNRMQSIKQLQQSELDREKRRLRDTQNDLEHKLLSLEGDLVCQKQEVVGEFEHILRERQEEFDKRTKDLQSSLSVSEGKVRELTRELDACRSNVHSLEDVDRERGEVLVKTEREVRQHQWAIDDQRSLHEGIVRDLERRLAQTEATASKQAEEFVKRHSELDHRVREKECLLSSVRDAHSKKVMSLEEQISNLIGQLEIKDSEMKRLLWQHTDNLKEKDLEIQRCREDVVRVKSECCEQVEQTTSELVTRDLQLQAVQDGRDHWREEAQQTSSQLQRCKEELVSMVTKDKEQKATVEQLTTVRDKLVTECRELKGKLSNHVTKPPDHASTQQDHVTSPDSHVIIQLQQQNSDLHSVIKQMRTELEQLAEPTNQIAASSDYVQYMEKELNKLKTTNRELEVKVQSIGKPPSSEKPPRSLSVEKRHRGHVIALSDTIATLQRDKTSLELELSQSKHHVEQLEGLVQEGKEKLYSLRSCQVPQNKVHQKLVQATHVIIGLVREKEALVSQVREFKGQTDIVRVDRQTQTETRSEVTSQIPDPNGDFPSPRSTREVPSTPPRDFPSPRTNLNSSTSPRDFPSTPPPPPRDFPSLRFTDSSLGSLEDLLQSVELTDSDPPHTSTPTGSHDVKLELVGRKAGNSLRPGPKFKGQSTKRQLPRNKKLVRNYNIKD